MGVVIGLIALIAGFLMGWGAAAFVIAVTADDKYDIWDEDTW